MPLLSIDYSSPSGGTGNSGSNNQAGVAAGTGQAPSGNISSIILPPANVKAEDYPLDYGESVKLLWDKSVSLDIDGYHIYRSEKESSDFTNMYVAAKDRTDLVDWQAKENHTYYYFIRAYKGDVESSNSNLASATARADIYDQSKNSKQSSGSWFWFIVILVIGFLLVAGIVTIVIIILLVRNKKTNNPPSPPVAG